MTPRAYSVALKPTVEQTKLLVKHTAAARRAFNWAFEAWQTWAGARALCIGFRGLFGLDEAGSQAAAALATGMAALSWSHGAQCPRRRGGKVCTKSTCDKSGVYQQLYEPIPNKNAIHSLLVRAIHTDPELAWLSDVSAYAIREAVKDLESAYQRFFRVLGKHNRGDHSECGVRREGGCSVGSPRWRTRKHTAWHSDEANGPKKNPLGFEVGAVGKSAQVKIPGVGWIKVQKGCRLPPPGAQLSAVAVSEKAGGWFAALRFKAPLTRRHGGVRPRQPGSRLGVETGVRELAVTSDGQRFDAVRTLASLGRAERKIRLWERRKSRRARLDAAGRLQGGARGQSRGWHEAVAELQKYHLVAANCRKNLLHQTSRALVDTGAETIVMRDQDVKRMLGRGARKHEREKRNKIAPLIQQCGGLYELRRQVEYKQTWSNGSSVVAPSDEPTTRRCWHCKAVRETEPPYGALGASQWECAACGAKNERETNAALNLRDYSPPSSLAGGVDRGRTGPGNGGIRSVGTAEITEVTGAVAHSLPDSGPVGSERSSKRPRGVGPRGKRGKAGNGLPAQPHPLRGNHVPDLQSACTREQTGDAPKASSTRTGSFAAGSASRSRSKTGPEQASKEGCLQTAPELGESTTADG